MSKLIVLCFLVLCISISLIVAQNVFDVDCPKSNQEFTSCGTACPSRCNAAEPTICTLQCIIGCQCMRGYKLNANGDCVLPEDC